MKKETAGKRIAVPKKPKPDRFSHLFAEVRHLIQSARHAAATAVNTLQVLTNFEIGRRIVEHEQKGSKRAAYGQELLNALAQELSQEFGAGFSLTRLKLMRQFYLEYRARIGPTVSDLSAPVQISPTLS